MNDNPENNHAEKQAILIVGCGRLGSRSIQELAKSHSNFILCDYDIVLEKNLEEQPLFSKEDIGSLKVNAVAKHLMNRHPKISIRCHPEPFSTKIIDTSVGIIIDGTDNLETRQELNRAALDWKIPLIIAAASKDSGIVFPVTAKDDVPCWECIAAGKDSDSDCSTGIDNDIADRIVKVQSELCHKLLNNELVNPELLLIGKTDIRRIIVNKNQDCVCSGKNLKHKASKMDSASNSGFSIKPCITGKRSIARIDKTIDLDKITHDVIKRYAQAILVNVGNGSALVHKYGVIELTGVDEKDAQEFVEKNFL